MEASFGAFKAGMGWLHGLFDEFGLSPAASSAFGAACRAFFGTPGDYLTGRLEWGSEKSPVRFQSDLLAEAGKDAEAALILPQISVRAAKGIFLRAGAFLVLGPDYATPKLGLFYRQTSLFAGLNVEL